MFNPLHEELERKSNQRSSYMNEQEMIRFYKEKDKRQTVLRLKRQALSNLGDWLISWGNQLKAKSLTLQPYHQD